MIIWINGAFGVGKTQTAYELHRRIENSFVYDPEEIGYFIRDHVPVQKNDFQDFPIWRSFNFDILKYLDEIYSGVIIVPMTVTRPEYYDEMIQRLKRSGVMVYHYILCAEAKTIQKRLKKRFERKGCWAEQQIQRCINAFEQDIVHTKIWTDHKTVCAAAEEIGRLSGTELLPDRRGSVKKKIDSWRTQIRHIR